jgi:hypothetical protein
MLGPSAFKDNGIINFNSYSTFARKNSKKLFVVDEQQDIQALRMTQYAGFLKNQ